MLMATGNSKCGNSFWNCHWHPSAEFHTNKPQNLGDAEKYWAAQKLCLEKKVRPKEIVGPQIYHGSLNVPIEHHPTIRYMVYNGYYKVMSNLPKMGHLPTPVYEGLLWPKPPVDMQERCLEEWLWKEAFAGSWLEQSDKGKKIEMSFLYNICA